MVDLEPFHRNIGEMLVASQRCIQLRQHMPALVLMYTLIDGLAWAASLDSEPQVRRRFESWVNRWLVPELAAIAPSVTATDLYAARCAVLHTLTGESDLSTSGRAKRFLYAWGTASTEVLDHAIQQSRQLEHVALHYDSLHTALVRAIAVFLDQANDDPVLSACLERAAGKHYMNIDSPGTA